MASNFLWFPGTGNNGLLTSVVSLLTTEIESLASAAVIVSSVNGTAGLFSTSNTGQGIWADLFLNVGNPGIGSALSAGANLAGWFLTTPDGGTTLESNTAAPPRSPDFMIPMPATTIAANAVFKANGLVLLPALKFFVLVQNNTGQAFGNGGTTAPFLKAAPVAIQY